MPITSVVPANHSMSVSLVLFFIICFVFLLASSTYMKLREYRNKESPHINIIISARNMAFWTMLLCGISIVVFVYLVLYHKPKPNEVFQFLGAGCDEESCSAGPSTS